MSDPYRHRSELRWAFGSRANAPLPYLPSGARLRTDRHSYLHRPRASHLYIGACKPMGTRWLRLRTALRNRYRFGMGRFRARGELVQSPLDLRSDPSDEPGYRPQHRWSSGDVVPLLRRGTGAERRGSENRGPEPRRTTSIGAVGSLRPLRPGTVPGPSRTVVLDPYQQDPAPGYSHATLGGWTVTTLIDCE
jgi:hypothetical protein